MSTSIRVLLVFKSAAEADEILTALHQHDLELSHRLVSSREELLQALGSQSWDIIITDYRVTDLAASELLDHLKSTAQSIPTIIVAQSIGEERVASLMQAGAADYVGRGNWERLRAVVRREIRGTAQRAERKAATEARLSVHAEMEREIQRRNEELSRLNRLLRDEVVIRRQAEEAQAAISKKYQALIETNNDFIWETDAQGRYTYCSPQMELLWGIRPEDMLGKTPFDVMPEDKRADALKGFLQMARSPRAFSGLETVAYDGRGQLIHIETSGVPFFDHRDNLLGFRGITRDITERKRAEEALRASEVRYRGVVENTTAIILRVDPQGIIRFANQRALEFFGYSEEELIGQPAIGTIVPERESPGRDLVAVIDGIRTAPDQWHFNANENMRKNGERVWMEWTNSGVYDANGNLEEFLSVGIDATKSKEAEEALRESEGRLRSVLDGSRDVLYRINVRTGRPEFVSRASRTVFGYLPEELMALDPEAAQALIHPDDLPKYLSAIARTSEVDQADVEYRQRTKSGEYLWLSTHMSLMRDERGEPLYRDGNIRDITERKQAEEALATVHHQTQSIIDGASSIIYAFDLEGRFILANAALAELLKSTPAQMIGRRRHEFMPEADANWHEANDRQVLEAGEALEFEEHSQLPDRSIAWLTTKFPLRDAQGKIYAVAGISADISERKKAELALRISEGKFRSIFESSPVDIALIALDGTFLDVNQAALDLHGYSSKQELLGKPCLSLVDESYHDAVTRKWNEVLASCTAPPVELVQLKADGSKINTLVSAVRLDQASGQPFAILAMVQDITERKRAEATLRESETRFRNLVKHAPAAIYEIDFRTRRFTSVNDAMCQLSGYSRDELLAMDATEILDEPSRAKFHKRIEQWLAGEEPDKNVEYMARGKDGHDIYAILDAAFVRDEQGRPKGAVVVAYDITDRRRMETELHNIADKYSAIINQVSDGVWIHDLSGQILEVNDAYCGLSGYARGELVGSPISLVEAAESPSEIKTHIGTLVERGGHDRFESRHRRKDGIIWDVDVTAVFLPRDGGQIAVFVRDITERKRIEADLLTSQQRLRAALANPRLTVWQQDKDLRYVWLHNPRLGFDATGIVGKTDTDLLPPVQAARLTAIKREVLETGISSHEEVDLTHEGATAWFDLTIEPVRDETGAVIAINCISVELPPGKAKRRDVQRSETASTE